MASEIKGIHNQTIGAYWTIFFLVFILLVTIGIRVWLAVGPAIQKGPPEPVRIDGGLKPPRLKTKVNPVLPERALSDRIKGEIILEVQTDMDGIVRDAKVLDIVPSFEKETGIWRLYGPAREAVLQWTFERFVYRGEYRPAIFSVTVVFE